jgi:hypothetical protein
MRNPDFGSFRFLNPDRLLVARTDLDYASNFTSFGLGAVPG